MLKASEPSSYRATWGFPLALDLAQAVAVSSKPASSAMTKRSEYEIFTLTTWLFKVRLRCCYIERRAKQQHPLAIAAPWLAGSSHAS